MLLSPALPLILLSATPLRFFRRRHFSPCPLPLRPIFAMFPYCPTPLAFFFLRGHYLSHSLSPNYPPPSLTSFFPATLSVPPTPPPLPFSPAQAYFYYDAHFLPGRSPTSLYFRRHFLSPPDYVVHVSADRQGCFE